MLNPGNFEIGPVTVVEWRRVDYQEDPFAVGREPDTFLHYSEQPFSELVPFV